MKKITLLSALVICCGILTVNCSENASVAIEQPNEAAVTTACKKKQRNVINADRFGRVTLQGYDAVAFHTESTAMRGDPYIVSEYSGYKYLFASEANKSLFDADPQKYLPAYGGFCAFGVSLGVLFPVEIETWEILDGRLILQFSDQFKQIFEQNLEENIHKADSTWQEIIEKKPKDQ